MVGRASNGRLASHVPSLIAFSLNFVVTSNVAPDFLWANFLYRYTNTLRIMCSIYAIYNNVIMLYDTNWQPSNNAHCHGGSCLFVAISRDEVERP